MFSVPVGVPWWHWISWGMIKHVFIWRRHVVSPLCCVGNRFNDWFIILFVHFLLTLAPEWVSIGAFIIYLEARRSIAASRKSGEKAFTGQIRNGRGRSGCGHGGTLRAWQYGLSNFFSVSRSFYSKQPSHLHGFAVEVRYDFIPLFAHGLEPFVIWTIHQWSSSVTENKLFFFRTDT